MLDNSIFCFTLKTKEEVVMYKFVPASKNDIERIIFDVISSKYIVYHIGGSFHFMKDGKFVFYISKPAEGQFKIFFDDFYYWIMIGNPGWKEVSDLYSIGSGLFYFKDRETAQKIMDEYKKRQLSESIKTGIKEYGKTCKTGVLLGQGKQR